MSEVLQETYIRIVPAKIYAKATGCADEESVEIIGHFLLKRQGTKIVLWEVGEFSEGRVQGMHSIGPVAFEDYCVLIERNFRCS